MLRPVLRFSNSFLPAGRAILVSLAFMVGLSGCASVRLNMGDEAKLKQAEKISHERAALAEASRALNITPWPEVSSHKPSARLVNLLFGKDEPAGMSREAACATYIESLSVTPQMLAVRIQMDADQTLARGRVVAEMGRQASQSLQPNQDDVVLMEAAIANLREARTMYVMSLKMARKRGAPITNSEIDDLSHAFQQTMTDIGLAADVVAQQAADNNRSNYAEPKGSATDGFSAR